MDYTRRKPTLVLIAQAVFVIDRGQTHTERQTDRYCGDATLIILPLQSRVYNTGVRLMMQPGNFLVCRITGHSWCTCGEVGIY